MNGVRLAAGLGCDRDTPLETVLSALKQALSGAGLAIGQVEVLASIDAKAGEPALLELAARLDRPLRLYPAEALARVPVPNPSQAVLRHIGTPSVSEAAALLAAGTGLHGLIVEKHRHRGRCGRHATVSLARVGTAPPNQEEPK